MKISYKLTIRLLIYWFIPIIVYIVACKFIDSTVIIDGKTYATMPTGQLALAILSKTLIAIYIMCETFWLHYREKVRERNANLIVNGYIILSVLILFLLNFGYC